MIAHRNVQTVSVIVTEDDIKRAGTITPEQVDRVKRWTGVAPIRSKLMAVAPLAVDCWTSTRTSWSTCSHRATNSIINSLYAFAAALHANADHRVTYIFKNASDAIAFKLAWTGEFFDNKESNASN